MDETSDDDAQAGQSSKEKFLELLHKMKLTDKYPQKLSLTDAMTLRQDTLGTVHTTDQLPVLPYLIIQKIMMSDQRCRSCLYKVSSSTTQSKPTNSDSDSELSDSDSDDMDDNRLHPVDCMLTVLHCCDDILRQDLISKLSFCQLAFPFLLPNPVDDSITFLLWAMRSLFRGWKSKSTGGKEHRIVSHHGPIVSFLRIGDSQSSKSEILNAVIGGALQYFFNRKECEGGDCERNFADGLVEMCCYFPSGKEDDCFSDPITYLNLRGDALKHHKQVKFLQRISFVNVVLITETNINESTVKVLQSLAEAPGGIIVLLAECRTGKGETKASRSKTQELLRQILPKNKISKLKLKSKNTVTLKTEIHRLLADKLDNAAPEHFKAISKCHEIAKEIGIKIDEEHEDSKIGRRFAEKIMEKVCSVNFNKVKAEMIPLQGPSLWHKWAKLDKEQHRHVEKDKEVSVTAYNEEKNEGKMKVRKEQLEKCKALTPVMNCFMEFMLDTNVNVRKYFLQWLKLFLDDHSRRILPKLLTDYQETRDRLNTLKQKYQSEENSQVKQLKEKQKRQNEELVNASFGLEHLLREMGQIYEARIDSGELTVSQTLKDKTNQLPQIMAEIMDQGHALELMDGDASHVPVLWVLAVLERLKAVCGKNARDTNGGKIFVLSVLGIQSSGKSTLLNTMFGLRFNVSAGRCTRGAYIQLLPLDNSLRQMINCDYVLIVDTEGLRAPELQLEGFKHDNELATFVIGLADATIINIFGETPGDLDDILQTSLHAFIRMRKVEMNPSCLFVHQNVPDVLASSKSMMGRQKFHSKLDNMTQAAAKIENCEAQFNSFNHVIDFDDSKDVFYFPSLWKGDPPMAPVNAGYSESAQTLKTELIKLTQRKQCRCSLETFKLRVTKLWEAVLQENFVFSFKNTLEVFAHNELDSQYAQWSWLLQSKILKWQNTTKWKINDCKTEDELTKEVDACLEEVQDEIIKTNKKVLEKMKSFLNTSDHSETLSQWEHETKKRIDRLFHENEERAKNYCDDLKKNKLISVEIENLEEQNIDDLNKHIKRLVDDLWRKEGRQQSDNILEQKFELKWKEWVSHFEKEKAKVVKYPSDNTIDTAVVHTLRELLPADDPMIIHKLSDKPLNQRSSSLEFSIDKKLHLTSKGKKVDDSDVQKATHYTKDILGEANKYLHDIQSSLKPFSPSLVYEVLRTLFSLVDDVADPKKKSKYTFTPEYKVEIGLVVCAHASKIFKQTTKKIKQENDPVQKLNTKKDAWLTNFKNMYRNIDAGKRAAINLCNLLSKAVKEAVIANLDVVTSIRRDRPYLKDKRVFKIQILEDLAFRKSPDLYETYKDDISRCFRYWIDHYIKEYCRCSPENITEPAKDAVKKTVKIISGTIDSLGCTTIKNTENWIKEFVNKLRGTLPLSSGEIKGFVGECDIGAFSEYIDDEFKKVEGNLLYEFNDASSIIKQLYYRSNSPEKILFNDLIGCTEKCPFCREQCYKPSYHSGDHEVSLHRPQCLGGYHNTGTKNITIETCSEAIADGRTFQNSDTNGKTVSYANYKDKNLYPHWYIPSYSCGDPKYWKWVVKEYPMHVRKWAGAEKANYPQKWNYITQSDAVYSLQSIY